MPKLKELQDHFSNYLLSVNDDIADLVIDQGSLDRYSRLDIYKNAYIVRLTKCIESDHPILAIYLGDELFEKLANGYVAEHPSIYISLRQYGDHLPDYLSQHEPFKSVPILTEIATFERMMMSAFDAADTDQRATVEQLQKIAPDDWPTIQLEFHPSVSVFEASWNSVEIWQALKDENTPEEASENQAYWLIWRGEDRLTQFRNMPLEAYLMFNCFSDNYHFADVCEFLLEHLSEDQISPLTVQHLTDWLQMGIIYKIKF